MCLCKFCLYTNTIGVEIGYAESIAHAAFFANETVGVAALLPIESGTNNNTDAAGEANGSAGEANGAAGDERTDKVENKMDLSAVPSSSTALASDEGYESDEGYDYMERDGCVPPQLAEYSPDNENLTNWPAASTAMSSSEYNNFERFAAGRESEYLNSIAIVKVRLHRICLTTDQKESESCLERIYQYRRLERFKRYMLYSARKFKLLPPELPPLPDIKNDVKALKKPMCIYITCTRELDAAILLIENNIDANLLPIFCFGDVNAFHLFKNRAAGHFLYRIEQQPVEYCNGNAMPQSYKILQRLAKIDVPMAYLQQGRPGIHSYARKNLLRMQQLVYTVFPPNDELNYRNALDESMNLLMWLMFENDPKVALETLKSSDNDQGVCGVIWGYNDIAYRCRTCESDPTSSICLTCFENGDHKSHDYSVIFTAGGCCDCGDTKAWSYEGCCSRHKGAGAELIQPLPRHVADSLLGPVLDSMLWYWTEKLLKAKKVFEESPVVFHDLDDLTSRVVGMLSDMSECSKSVSSFISLRICSTEGLLDVLVSAEMFLEERVFGKLHELFLRMLHQPTFRIRLRKSFVDYYPAIVKAAVDNGTDFISYPLLSMFSVQLLTVPSDFVEDKMDMLDMLLKCLECIFNNCAGVDGKPLVTKWASLYEITLHVVEDIRFVMSHTAVPTNLYQHRRDLVRKWMKLLALVQQMNTQKRKTVKGKQEHNNFHLPFVLCNSLSNVLSLLVAGAFSVSINGGDDSRTIPNEEIDHEVLEAADDFSLPPSASWLVNQCLRSIESVMGLGVGSESGQPVGQVGSGGSEQDSLQFLSSLEWPGITYDVSSQEISVHITLHRLLSLILRKALKECYGVLSSATAEHSPIEHGDFLCQCLDGSRPCGFSAYIMEHPLRIRVFCAQVHAQMWDNNGPDPKLFSEWYRSVQWSEQGQELDLFLLQCCAALAPPDSYVQRILERFGLSNYLNHTEQPTEGEAILIGEMITLLIQIVNERWHSGLTTADCLQRILVHKLAVKDCTHSELMISIPHDISDSPELQEVLDRVAEYSHPSGITQGLYKLRKEYWKELELYHAGWNLRDQQDAEKRYLDVFNVSAQSCQLPRWTSVFPPLMGIAKIATCRTLLEIVRAVLFNAFSKESAALGGLLIRALHLLALALDISKLQKETSVIVDFASEATSKYGEQSMLSILIHLMHWYGKEDAQNVKESEITVVSSLIKEIVKTFEALEPLCTTKFAPLLANEFVLQSNNARGVNFSVESLERKTKSEQIRDAIMEKMKADQLKFLKKNDSGEGSEMEDDTEAQVICCQCHDPKPEIPVLYLVHLQRSRLLSFVEHQPPSWDQISRSDEELVLTDTTASNILVESINPDASEASQSQFEDLFSSALKDFASVGRPQDVNAFMKYVKARIPIVKEIQPPPFRNDVGESTTSFEALEEEMYLSMRNFVSSSNTPNPRKENGDFSTTGSSRERSDNAESLLLGTYIAGLPIMPQGNHSSSGLMKGEFNTLCQNFGPAGADGIFISSCGHAVHQECLDVYISALKTRVTGFEGSNIVDLSKGEVICPACRIFANSVLPVLPGDKKRMLKLSSTSSPLDFSDSGLSLRLQDAFLLIQKAASVAGDQKSVNAVPIRNSRTNPEHIIHSLCGMYFPGQEKILDTGRVSHPLILWDTLKYSLISVEIAARSTDNSLSPNYSSDALYRKLHVSSVFTLSMVLDITARLKTIDPHTVLLRFQALQLFAKCLSNESSCGMHGGNMLQLLVNLENCELQSEFPDIQLWRQAHEPVIAHDAFTSFMWILFCLPWPVLSCKESFFSLVHAFYLVSITQAIVTSYSIQTEVDVSDNLKSDIYRLVGKHPQVMQFFKSYCVDSASSINDSICSITSPYLRRCALLWELIDHSNVMPYSNESCSVNDVEYLSAEGLWEVGKLKKMFHIPPLDIIFNDKVSRLAASKWVDHFCCVFKAHTSSHVLRISPPAPFKLMVLPSDYKDVLQRYFKKCCPECGTVNEEPALCLLCGRLCSPNSRFCCRESTCQTHASVCGAGIGVYLLIRSTTILLQRSKRQAPWPSPYLDAFGEEDIEMQRGKPLFLNQERYGALSHMVASHGLDRDSMVLQETTISPF